MVGGESQGETETQERRDKQRVRQRNKKCRVQKKSEGQTQELRGGVGRPTGVERHVRQDTGTQTEAVQGQTAGDWLRPRPRNGVAGGGPAVGP